ncbi:HCL191Cp [Eremothecium sinecaudum]|uniref:HCL191Cp n=1 Tax=Eremothecium sinecaudum TaxID=45286 RepID=A0A0X8HR81_9SACH|nr:HCL191Cp [Eremothecium sinecaudum]AMD19960.1 HCL191Cp [Eremothecium sinecaudum]
MAMITLSEVETHDGLPFVKPSGTSYSLDEKIVAPSIEEVDDDPEMLRNLRGQGRYFGAEKEEDGIKEAEPKCKNCSQRGHIKKNCPHVICSYCGLMDDHYSQHCPKTMRCSHCNESGHYRQHCSQKWKRIFCTLCNSKKHSRDRCPSIWRSYCLASTTVKRVLPSHRLYCYNCAGKGHFGDDCPLPRSSRVPNDDGSAFSGDNLASDLRREYFNRLSKQKREYEYYEETEAGAEEDTYHINYDDYEVDESQYANESKSRNRKRKRNNDNNYYGTNKSNSNRNGLPVPVSKGRTLQPPNSRWKNSLTFPRGGNNGNGSSVIGSRYLPPAPYQNDVARRNYNSYQPYRSGTLARKR